MKNHTLIVTRLSKVGPPFFALFRARTRWGKEVRGLEHRIGLSCRCAAVVRPPMPLLYPCCVHQTPEYWRITVWTLDWGISNAILLHLSALSACLSLTCNMGSPWNSIALASLSVSGPAVRFHITSRAGRHAQSLLSWFGLQTW